MTEGVLAVEVTTLEAQGEALMAAIIQVCGSNYAGSPRRSPYGGYNTGKILSAKILLLPSKYEIIFVTP